MEDGTQVLPLAGIAVEGPAFGELAQLVALKGERGGAVVADRGRGAGAGGEGVQVWRHRGRGGGVGCGGEVDDGMGIGGRKGHWVRILESA